MNNKKRERREVGGRTKKTFRWGGRRKFVWNKVAKDPGWLKYENLLGFVCFQLSSLLCLVFVNFIWLFCCCYQTGLCHLITPPNTCLTCNAALLVNFSPRSGLPATASSLPTSNFKFFLHRPLEFNIYFSIKLVFFFFNINYNQVLTTILAPRIHSYILVLCWRFELA